MNEITLHNQWVVKASLNEVFNIMTDFEKFPEYFPKVADAVRIDKREGDNLEMEATARSFGRALKVRMKTRILPGKSFILDNDSYEFGTSGHKELFLSAHPAGTLIDYTYHVTIHKVWLRIVVGPLLRGYAMKSWEKAVIDRLRDILEKK